MYDQMHHRSFWLYKGVTMFIQFQNLSRTKFTHLSDFHVSNAKMRRGARVMTRRDEIHLSIDSRDLQTIAAFRLDSSHINSLIGGQMLRVKCGE